jgi:WhiB family redox-sensing transcriptional regulator
MSMPTSARSASASWESQAACLTSDPDLFFPIGPAGPALQQIAQAKAICARCPVRCDCLQFALATHQVHGVWGGTSEEERQLLPSHGPNGTPGHGAARPAARPGALTEHDGQ